MAKIDYPMDLRGQEMKGCSPCEVDDYKNLGPHISLEWEEPYDFPDDGEMTVRFRVRKREEETDSKGKKSYEIRLELLEITKMKSASPIPPASSGSEAGSALDKLRAEMED